MWPGGLERLEKSNVRNFTIYYSPSLYLLFSHMEYIGNDFDGDMKLIADHEETRVNLKLYQTYSNKYHLEMVENHGRISSSAFMARSTTK